MASGGNLFSLLPSRPETSGFGSHLIFLLLSSAPSPLGLQECPLAQKDRLRVQELGLETKSLLPLSANFFRSTRKSASSKAHAEGRCRAQAPCNNSNSLARKKETGPWGCSSQGRQRPWAVTHSWDPRASSKRCSRNTAVLADGPFSNPITAPAGSSLECQQHTHLWEQSDLVSLGKGKGLIPNSHHQCF